MKLSPSLAVVTPLLAKLRPQPTCGHQSSVSYTCSNLSCLFWKLILELSGMTPSLLATLHRLALECARPAWGVRKLGCTEELRKNGAFIVRTRYRPAPMLCRSISLRPTLFSTPLRCRLLLWTRSAPRSASSLMRSPLACFRMILGPSFGRLSGSIMRTSYAQKLELCCGLSNIASVAAPAWVVVSSPSSTTFRWPWRPARAGRPACTCCGHFAAWQPCSCA